MLKVFLTIVYFVVFAFLIDWAFRNTLSAITDIQKYFQRAISPLVSLRTTLR